MLKNFHGLEDFSAESLSDMDKNVASTENIRSFSLSHTFHKGSTTGVLLIHGLGGSPKEMEPLACFLIKAGYTVYSARVAGHGGSFENMASKTYEDWYNSLRFGYFALKNTCKKVCVVGQSNGGLLASLIALYNPVDSIVLLAPAFKVRAFFFPLVKFLRKYLKGVRRKLDETKLQFNQDMFPYESLYQMLLMQKFVYKNISLIKPPVLLGISYNDLVISSDAAKKCVDNMGSGLKEYAFYSNTEYKITHILTEEHLKDVVFCDVLNWIKCMENNFNKKVEYDEL